MLTLKDRMVVSAFRKNCTKSDAKRDEGLTVPDDVSVIKDLSYGEDPVNNILDVYKPKGADGKLPVLVSSHGGGYIYGDKELYSFYTMTFAQNGFAVVNYNYTLAPKITFPNPIIETNEVLKWVCQNADKYGFDLDNVVMIGDSAGAQIASQYAVCVTNSAYAKVMGIEVPSFTLKALSLGCGIYSVSDSGSSTRDLERIYLTRNPGQFGEKIKIFDYVTSDYPPTYLLSSPGDFLVKNLDPFKELLKSKNVECDSKIYGDKNTYHVFFEDIRNDLAKEANKDQVDFLKKHVG